MINPFLILSECLKCVRNYCLAQNAISALAGKMRKKPAFPFEKTGVIIPCYHFTSFISRETNLCKCTSLELILKYHFPIVHYTAVTGGSRCSLAQNRQIGPCPQPLAFSMFGAPLRSHLPSILTLPSQHPGILCNACIRCTLFVIAFVYM